MSVSICFPTIPCIGSLPKYGFNFSVPLMCLKSLFHKVPAGLGKLRDEVLFGDVWEQPELSKRDRSLVTCSVLAALYRTPELEGHLQRALDNGVTIDELKGMITHVAFYSGWPTAVNAGRVLQKILEKIED